MTETYQPEILGQEEFSTQNTRAEEQEIPDIDLKLEGMFKDACAIIELNPRPKKAAESFIKTTKGQAMAKSNTTEQQKILIDLANMLTQKYLS